MKFRKYLTENLSQFNSEKFSGILYRAVDHKFGEVLLGYGMYLTPEYETAKMYGKKIKKYRIKNLKVLGYYTQEYSKISKFVTSDKGYYKYKDSGDPVAEMIRQEAEDRGYEAIYAGEPAGIVIFPKAIKKVKEVK